MKERRLCYISRTYYNRQTKTAVNKAMIQKQNYLLDLQDKQTTLYSTVENYWLQAVTNQNKFKAAKHISNLYAGTNCFCGISGSVRVPWEKLSLATLRPALHISVNTFGSLLAGPIVHTIFVFLMDIPSFHFILIKSIILYFISGFNTVE